MATWVKVFAERERKSGSLVIELTPEDYSYELLAQQMIKEKEGAWAKQGAYTAAWKYLIYNLVIKELNKSTTGMKRGAAAAVHDYLRDNFRGEQTNPIAMMISYLKRLEGIKIGPFEAAVKAKELTQLYRLEEINRILPSVYELCNKKSVTVLVDELDKGWDASEDAKSFVSGLVQAAISINEGSKNLRVLVSLRKELYDSIPSLYEDAQKYRDIMEVVSWDEESLLSLIAKRIRHTVPETHRLTDEECWNSVFVEILQYRQTKSFNYIVDRTLYRPREIIQFCTESLQETQKNLAFPIDYPIVSRCEVNYSTQRSQDIAAEYRFQYPGLDSVFEAFRGKTYSFTREGIDDLCLSMAVGETKVKPEATKWILDQDPEYITDVLWRVGFLRAQAVGGVKALRRSGSRYLGSYQVENLSLRNIQRFDVHPMFRSGLGMKEAKEKLE